MSKPQIRFPLLWIIPSLMIGIGIGDYYPITFVNSWSLVQIVIAAGIGLFLLWKLKQRALINENRAPIFSVGMVFLFIGIGMALVAFHNPTLRKNHYSNTKAYHNTSTATHLLFQVSERLKPTTYYEKYRIDLLQIAHQNAEVAPTTGSVLLRIPKAQLKEPLKIDDQYLVFAQMQPIPSPLNPHQFDYNAYRRRQYIYRQIKADVSQLTPVTSGTITLQGIASRFRNFLIDRLDQAPFGDQELAIIKALILGQRQDIAPETYANYTKAGAIHILAVSGLHIGILLWLLTGLLAPLSYGRWGKELRTMIIIVLLFGYALITGLSPSVLRAVTMFAFIAIGLVLPGKKSNLYNALLISAFFLLCFQPLLMFDVGFQLSYLAVLAILWLQPLMAKWYQPRYMVDRIYWNTFTVTIAAQLGLLPLSVFYFHQFPLLFFVSNLIIVPFLGVIFGFGLVVLMGAALDSLPMLVAKSYNLVLWIMNMVIEWVAAQESFLLTNIPLSWSTMGVSYLVMISGVFYFKKFQAQRFYYLLGSGILFVAVLIYERYETATTERLLLFHQSLRQKGSGNTILAHQRGAEMTVYSTKKIEKNTQNHLLTPYKNAMHIATQKEALLQHAYCYNGKLIYIIDRTGHYRRDANIRPDIVVLSNMPRIHLERLLDSLQPALVVADGSTYTARIDQWQMTCAKRKVPFYRTDQRGAYLLE